MMIRIASPSVVFPLALRAIGSNSTTLTRTIAASQQSKYSHSSSVASREDSVNATLCNVFLNEINSIKSNIVSQEVKKAPDYFPFKIEVAYRSYYLERKLPDGEEVRVAIYMNDVIKKETEPSNCDDKESIGRKKDIKEAAIPMTVKLYKPGKDGEYVEFEITLSKEDITVEQFTFFQGEGYVGIPGPKFKEMDCVLQQWLRKYLEIRGIKTNIASYLLKYIAMENQKEDIRVLNDLNDYIFH